MDIKEVAATYESAALRSCREAEEQGEEAPKLVSVFARQGGYTLDFLAPRASLLEVRRAIINAGGVYRAAFI